VEDSICGNNPLKSVDWLHLGTKIRNKTTCAGVCPVPGTEIWRERERGDCAAGGTIRGSKATAALPTNDEISSTRSPRGGTLQGRKGGAVASCHGDKRGWPPPDLEMEASGVCAAGKTGGCSVGTVWGNEGTAARAAFSGYAYSSSSVLIL
jgi:hypothetical protein